MLHCPSLKTWEIQIKQHSLELENDVVLVHIWLSTSYEGRTCQYIPWVVGTLCIWRDCPLVQTTCFELAYTWRLPSAHVSKAASKFSVSCEHFRDKSTHLTIFQDDQTVHGWELILSALVSGKLVNVNFILWGLCFRTQFMWTAAKHWDWRTPKTGTWWECAVSNKTLPRMRIRQDMSTLRVVQVATIMVDVANKRQILVGAVTSKSWEIHDVTKWCNMEDKDRGSTIDTECRNWT